MSIRRMMLFTLGGFFKSIVSLFKTRVLSDNGTFEAETNLENQLNTLGSDLFNSASLVITPNGVKTSKLYSIKSNDGAGDLSVLRATSATRINSAGLIEIPATNLVLRSEEFNDTYWGKAAPATIITPNTSTAPNDTLTAEKITESNNVQEFKVYRNSISGLSQNTDYTFSVFAKSQERQFFYIQTASGIGARFDLINGSFIGNRLGAPVSSGIKNIGNGWYRCWIVLNTGAGSSIIPEIGILAGNNNVSSYQGVEGNGILIWGAQFEQGITATEYIPTTSIIRTRFAGITQDGGSASNIPRIDYTTGSPAILVEPQRTNLFLWSDMFTNASWTKNNTTVSNNTIISPSGLQDADKLSENTNINYHGIFSPQTVVVGTVYTISIFVKKGTRRYVGLECFYNASKGNIAFFDLDTNSLLYQFSQGAGYSITNSKIEICTNGWVRLSASVTFGDTDAYPGLSLANTRWTTGSAHNNLYAGNVNEFVNIWGAQLEAGSNATSYIPTTTSSVTRNADVINKNGVSNLIGQSKGSLVYYFIKNSNNSIPTISLSNNGTNPRFYPYESGTNYIFFLQAASAILVSYVYPLSNFITGLNKIGITYGAGSFKIYINGSLITSVPYTEQNLSFSQLNIGSSIFSTVGNTSNNNLVLINKEILSESEMNQLTTL